ncbi:hypothetical protein DFH08DRAFT_796991 [Mycena albidolilacea]|uniref:Uncharacterized protein n=1 Tax=Mycena albidolilacea TaxID=1033008 RepID=A0AAD7F5A2_9AGAR|nr:hypothetical protein DFH08DRAFT_796991 [Mycena albidolilacea]
MEWRVGKDYGESLVTDSKKDEVSREEKRKKRKRKMEVGRDQTEYIKTDMERDRLRPVALRNTDSSATELAVTRPPCMAATHHKQTPLWPAILAPWTRFKRPARYGPSDHRVQPTHRPAPSDLPLSLARRSCRAAFHSVPHIHVHVPGRQSLIQHAYYGSCAKMKMLLSPYKRYLSLSLSDLKMNDHWIAASPPSKRRVETTVAVQDWIGYERVQPRGRDEDGIHSIPLRKDANVNVVRWIVAWCTAAEGWRRGIRNSNTRQGQDRTRQDKTSAWTWMLDRSQTRDGELVLCAYAGIKVKVKIQPVDGHARTEI